MIVGIMGDIHGELWYLEQEKLKGIDLLIQVGDFGYLDLIPKHLTAVKPEAPTWFIAGNHESLNSLKKASDDERVHVGFGPRITYIPRGYVVRIGNKNVGFLGGAETPLRFRNRFTPGLTLFEREGIEERDFERLKQEVAENGDLDILITHSPPLEALTKMVGEVYETNSATYVQRAIELFKPQEVYCGHMHMTRFYNIGDTRCYCLDSGELIVREW